MKTINYTPSKKDLKELSETILNSLIAGKKIKFSRDKKWSDSFPNEAGVYAVFDKEEFVYIGETANVKERIKEIKRTYNHAFRKKLGRFLRPGVELEGNKFPQDLEEELDAYFLENISISAMAVSFGRLEIETQIINEHPELLNTQGKRSKIN